MVTDEDFQSLCGLVAELATHTKRVALGTQGLSVDQELTELTRKIEDLRDKSRG